MRHVFNVQVPPAMLRLLSALPVIAGVCYALVRLAELVPVK